MVSSLFDVHIIGHLQIPFTPTKACQRSLNISAIWKRIKCPQLRFHRTLLISKRSEWKIVMKIKTRSESKGFRQLWWIIFILISCLFFSFLCHCSLVWLLRITFLVFTSWCAITSGRSWASHNVFNYTCSSRHIHFWAGRKIGANVLNSWCDGPDRERLQKFIWSIKGLDNETEKITIYSFTNTVSRKSGQYPRSLINLTKLFSYSCLYRQHGYIYWK